MAGLEAIQQLAKPRRNALRRNSGVVEVALELQALRAVTKLLREVEHKLEAFAASSESVKL